MANWVAFPYADKAYEYTAAGLQAQWPRLHRGDCEPWPQDPDAVRAWIAFHAGHFERTLETGSAAGGGGMNAANKASAIYATHLEKSTSRKLELFEDTMRRAEALIAIEPENANAHYLYALAAGRYSRDLSVTMALAQGLGGKIRDALQQTLKLAPRHAEAHLVFGTWHAEVIDKVGTTVAGLTYGAGRNASHRHFRIALELDPGSATARIEYANAMLLLEGRKAMPQAKALYAEAAQCEAADAMERLAIESARKAPG